jgi:aminoglycoside 6-adenylyltransferase
MRSEKEILDLVLRFANQDDNIRLVLMNGSRANPHAKKDPFQDYDIACVVRDVKPYWQNQAIPEYFGEIMILQTPDDMGDDPADESHYAYLMQFMDGTRIDLSFHCFERLDQVLSDTLTIVLLDKDALVTGLPPSNDSWYYPTPPTEKQFFDCCNEFWWLIPYVAKGLWRSELTYAKYCQDVYGRGQLMIMLTWYFGVQTQFKKSPGKFGKYLQGDLDPDLWGLLEQTYSGAETEHIWESLLAMGELFRRVGRQVADHFHYSYPDEEDAKVTAYIRHIRNLPKDAETIY